MKKLFLIFGSLLCLFTFSCSEDDNDIVIDDNDTIVISEKYLSEIKTNSYNSAVGLTGYSSKIYENNRPIIEISYDMNDDTISKQVWTYSNNKLTLKELFSRELPTAYQLFEYDSNDRIISTEQYSVFQSEEFYNKVYFTYESDSTIISKKINLFNTQEDTIYKTFLLNDNGLIYKQITNQNFTTEIIYDNDNNATALNNTNNETSVTYTYDEIHFSLENFPIYDNFIHGNYSNNSFLYRNGISVEIKNEASLVPKFIINREIFGFTNESWEWTFDNENYPLTRNYYYNSFNSNTEFVEESEYFYD